MKLPDLDVGKLSPKARKKKDRRGAQIAELKEVKDGVDKEVTRLDADIKAAGGPSGEVTGTEPPPIADPLKLPASVFDSAFKDVTKKLIDRFNEAPKLNASLRLDNFLQMQYEIIAKQLTLLRDEVGPGERIIFLEMPQTVNASYDKANKKWAQSWWKILGYTAPKEQEPNTEETSVKRLELAGNKAGDEKEPLTMKKVVRSALDAFGTDGRGGNSDRVAFVSLEPSGGTIKVQDRSVRTIELIPRQSSLNVNDVEPPARSGALTAIAKTLFGVGARLNYQRQRETYRSLYNKSYIPQASVRAQPNLVGRLRPCPAQTVWCQVPAQPTR